MLNLDLAAQRHREVRAQAERAAFRRRVVAARRWRRRAQYAAYRARLAGQEVR